MALSGSFSTSVTTAGGQLDDRYPRNLVVTWSATQNIANNTSTISWVLKTGSASTSTYYTSVNRIQLIINGTTVFNDRSTGVYRVANETLGSGSLTVSHNSDGTKSVSIYAEAGFYDWSVNSTGSGTITLDTIPRASSMSFPEFTMGSAGTLSISRASSSFTHTITYVFGSKSGTIVSGTSNTSVSWTPSLSELAGQIPSSTRGYGTLYLYTYSGSTQIGSKSYTFYCNIPSNVVPSVGTITLDPSDINGYNILVKGKNKLTVSVFGCSAGTGSSIKSYTFSGPSISSTTTNTSVSANSVQSSGTLTYKVTVTDQRGRTASKSATITCYNYYTPYFKSFNAYRADSNGTANNNGTYLKCTYSVAYAPVNSTNVASMKITYTSGGTSKTVDVSGSSALINLGDSTSTYKVYAKITDAYGGSSASDSINVFGASRIFNVAKDGMGFAVGKMSEKTDSDTNGLFECAFDANFYRNIVVNGKTLLDWTHPVGSIYQSTVSTSPATLFGGTWEQLSGRFLIAANSTYSAGSTGGEASHTLTVNEMPSHEGHLVSNNYSGGSDVGTAKGKYLAASTMSDYENDGRGWNLVSNNEIYPPGYSRGGGQAHNNMPPYLAVYMWKRVS